MELEKHEKEISAKHTLKEKLTLHPTHHGQQFGKRDIKVTSPLSFLSTERVPSGESGTKPLTFTFVPSIGRLPTHFQVVDVCKLLVRTSEEPNNESSQEIINRSTIVSDDLALKSGIRQDSESTYHAGTSQKIFQPKEYKMSKGDMQEGDLFKAEFVFITDSDEGDEETVSRNSVQQPSVGHGIGHARCQLLATSHISSGGESSKPHGDLNVPETQCAALSVSATRSPKQRQLTSPSTFDHLSHKPPAACLISPTKLKVECEIVNPKQASSLEESYNKWQSAARSSKQDSSTCFQATAHSSPLYMPQRSPSVLNSPSSSTQFSNNLQMPNIAMPNYVYNTSEFTASSDPSKSPTPVSYFPNSAGMPGSPDQSVSPCSSKKFNTFFATPVHITAHSLSPSPKPLSSPFYGSSSTICSVNEPCSRMSSSGNLLKSGIRSPLPTRLSLLTAILKSGLSQQRPLSPASCPPTFSPNSLCSSTCTVDQKFKTSPPTPKKSASSFSIKSNSPSQEEHWPSLLSHSPIHVPLSSKPISTRARSLSPKKHLHARTLSPDSLYPLSSTISPYRKTVVSPLLQPKSPSVPPPVPRHSSSLHPALSPTKPLPYPVHKPQRPEKSRRVHTYSPTFTCKSYPLSSPANEKGIVSPILEKCSSSSPNLMHPTYKSKAGSSQMSAQELNPVSPTPSNVSTHWSSSPATSTSPICPPYNIHSHSPQLNSSSLHPKHRVYSSAARPKQLPTISVTPCRSPVPGQSPCTPLSRSRELSSPKSFSRPPDHESLKPKQYKIKTSYKAFAAIPTNTLLMEQKALEEPIKTEKVTEDATLDTNSEMCSPAQLRQQTEELCAAIDQVLQDPLPMRRCESSPSSLHTSMDSDVGKMSATLQRAAGRETRYANLYLLTPTVTESQLTKPGVIRPGPVKTKILLKTEEPYQPNPFKKYLEETRDPDIEKDNAPLHPLYPTKLIPPTKSPLHPQSICHADCLTPGPFSHLSSILCDVHESSYRPYSRNALYNKPSHPIVPIPENKALSSKEFHSAVAPSKSDLPPTCESKKTSKGKLPGSESPLCTERFSLSVDVGDAPAKTS
ncbi:muscular LMNA-interacting protein isoform X1 [Caretta caretta]|uniref:muscular LMNA-interacting protein isoform X1 n=2 Tax=Caretta caretta TaxID=8467 RepID=UPI003F4B21F7